MVIDKLTTMGLSTRGAGTWARQGGAAFLKGTFNTVCRVIQPTLVSDTVKTLQQNHSSEYVA